jgi:hypothetical protein
MNAVRSYREVAQVLGVSPQVVQRIEFQALKKCRAVLLRDCPDDFEDVREVLRGDERINVLSRGAREDANPQLGP